MHFCHCRYVALLAWAVPDAAERYARDGASGEDVVERLRAAARSASAAAVAGADAATWANAALEIAARGDKQNSAASSAVPDFGARLAAADSALHELHYAFTKYRGATEAAFWLIYRHTFRQQLPAALAREGIATPVVGAPVARQTAPASANANAGEGARAAGGSAETGGMAGAATALVRAILLPAPDAPLDADGAEPAIVVVSEDGFVVVPARAADVAAVAAHAAPKEIEGAYEFSIFHILNFAMAKERFVFQATRAADKEMRVYTLASDALRTALLHAAVRKAIDIKMGKMNAATTTSLKPAEGDGEAEADGSGGGSSGGAFESFSQSSWNSAWCTTQ